MEDDGRRRKDRWILYRRVWRAAAFIHIPHRCKIDRAIARFASGLGQQTDYSTRDDRGEMVRRLVRVLYNQVGITKSWREDEP